MTLTPFFVPVKTGTTKVFDDNMPRVIRPHEEGMSETEDQIIERIFKWFIGFLAPNEWKTRKEAIEAELECITAIKGSRDKAFTLNPLSISGDRMGWYLYLAETSLYAPYKYEPIQGSRVLPIFKRLGTDFDLLKQIQGLDDKVRNLLYTSKSQPDGRIFEILIALLWLRNGWPFVELLPENPPKKQPDIRARSEKQEWFVETKRLAKSSEYSQYERQKWLSMWRHLSDFLVDSQISCVLDIVFHVELDSLPETFLYDELAGKLPLISPPCHMISNETWDISVSSVDFEAGNARLKKYDVRFPSDQLDLLIAGRHDPNRGFTGIVGGQSVQIGEGGLNNLYLETMDFAAGAFWECDAEQAIERKARDIRGHLSEAVEQLPDDTPGVVHIGLETLDGRLVEFERLRRIVNSVSQFDARGKDLRWIYCHLYQSYTPPNKAWVIDETVYYFSGEGLAKSQGPLSNTGAVVDENDIEGSGFVHWLKEPP